MSRKRDDESSRSKFAAVCLNDESHGPADPSDVAAMMDAFFAQWGESLYASRGGDDWWFYADDPGEERALRMSEWVDGFLAARRVKS